MKSFRLTPLAEDDVFNIWTFIADKDLAAADRLEAAIFEACQKVAERPDLGHWRRDITDKRCAFSQFEGLTLLFMIRPVIPWRSFACSMARAIYQRN